MSITVIIVFIVISIILSGLIILVNYLIATKSFYKEKVSAYECGFSPFGSSRDLFDVHFYIVSILFIIFDLEIVFLFPWAINLMTISNIGNNAVVMFLIILAIGLFYE
jgi:NADH-quinone oxidoreductase subunit A